MDKIQPAGPASPGAVLNSDDPEDQQSTIIGVCVMLMILAFAFLSIRLYSNFMITRVGGYDDYLCIVTTILSFAYMSLMIRFSYASRHIWDFPLQWYDEEYRKLRVSSIILMLLAFLFSRLPIFALFLRLFGKRRGFRYAVYAGIVANFPVYIAPLAILCHYCTPASGYDWAEFGILSNCTKMLPVAMVLGSTHLALDIYIFILPLPVIWALNMPLKKRLGVLAIFTTGFIAVVTAGLGLYYRYKLAYGNDVTWYDARFAIASAVEVNTVIICSCIPACPAFFNHFFSRSSSSSSPSSSPSPSNTATTTARIQSQRTSKKIFFLPTNTSITTKLDHLRSWVTSSISSNNSGSNSGSDIKELSQDAEAQIQIETQTRILQTRTPSQAQEKSLPEIDVKVWA